MTLSTPNGAPLSFVTRDGTNDATIASAVNVWDGVVNDEYRMAGRVLSGWAMDVGAHIGTLTIPLALDHPDLRVIAIEGVPDNCDLIRQNAAKHGVADRIEILNAYAAAPGTLRGVCSYGYRHAGETADEYVRDHRFVGGTWDNDPGGGAPEFRADLPAVSLGGVLERYGIDELALLKIDCEGCEWAFLDDPAVAKVAVIVGEYHGRPSDVPPMDRLRELLPTHEVTKMDDSLYDIGAFEAVRR